MEIPGRLLYTAAARTACYSQGFLKQNSDSGLFKKHPGLEAKWLRPSPATGNEYVEAGLFCVHEGPTGSSSTPVLLLFST